MRAWVLCAAAVAGVSGLVPTPIGTGPRYQPPPRGPLKTHYACRPLPLAQGPRVHLELFANRRVVIVPAGIGLERPRPRLGRVVASSCRGPLWSLDPSGVVRYEPGARLGDFFAVWGEPLGPDRLASFRGRVAVYVDGARRFGDPRRLRLRNRDEIVLEVGGYVPPHPSFRFPP